MSGAWDDRGCTSNSADGSILHGNSVCFAKGQNTSRLVFRDKSLQETLGKLCKRESNDEETKRSIIAMVTILMAIGFIMMNNVPIGRVVLVIVWIFISYILD